MAGIDAGTTDPYVLVHRNLRGEIVAELQAIADLTEALNRIHFYADHLRAAGATGEIAIFNRTTGTDIETISL